MKDIVVCQNYFSGFINICWELFSIWMSSIIIAIEIFRWLTLLLSLYENRKIFKVQCSDRWTKENDLLAKCRANVTPDQTSSITIVSLKNINVKTNTYLLFAKLSVFSCSCNFLSTYLCFEILSISCKYSTIFSYRLIIHDCLRELHRSKMKCNLLLFVWLYRFHKII